MKRFLLTALTILATATPALAAPFPAPQAADVNRFRYDLQRYEKDGGFNVLSQMGKCDDPFKNVVVENIINKHHKAVSVLLDNCLCDKLFAKQNIEVSYGIAILKETRVKG
jgi:hypothetical protein